jgi:hypothetical protein
MVAGFATEGRRFRVGEHEQQCSFCLRERADVESLVAAPAVSICLGCVTRCKDEATVHSSDASPYRASGRACSFCQGGSYEAVLVAEHARICVPCALLAAEVLAESADSFVRVVKDKYDEQIDAALAPLRLDE